jgi:hypothetical protein
MVLTVSSKWKDWEQNSPRGLTNKEVFQDGMHGIVGFRAIAIRQEWG